MRPDVFRSREGFQVLYPVIGHVVVAVMHDMAAREWTVMGLPRDDGAQSPDVGLGNLHEPSTLPPSSPNPQSLSTNRHVVGGYLSGLELGVPRSPCAARRGTEIAGADGRAFIRAVVDRPEFGRLPVRLSTTGRARRRDPLAPRQGRALSGAEAERPTTTRPPAVFAVHADSLPAAAPRSMFATA